MLNPLTNLAVADTGVLASHRGGDHRGGGFFFLLLLLALVGVGIYLWRRRRGDTAVDSTPPPAPPAPVNGAKALLDERFAKGEIDQAEYEHRRAVLVGDAAAPPASAPEAPVDEPDPDESK